VLRIPTPSGPQQTLGSEIHSILQKAGQALKENQPMTLQDLVAEFESRWRTVRLDDPDRKERLRARGREILQRFMGMQAKRQGRPVELERSFSVDLHKARLTGRIDRIDKTPTGYEVIDYKTGKQTSVELKADLQLPIYSLACHELLGEYPANVTYMFLGDDTVHQASYDAEALENVKSAILDKADQINSSDFAATPGRHCANCDFNNICPARQR
jgi:RecB family exonuclease